MKHIALESEDEHVKQFVLSLQLDSEGSVLELDGKPVARVLPVEASDLSYDPEKLASAILARRDESRRSNADWENADRDVWGAEGGDQP